MSAYTGAASKQMEIAAPLPRREMLRRCPPNADLMLFERNRSRDLKCRVCSRYHNPVTGKCGCLDD